jgi:hypothetical protein
MSSTSPSLRLWKPVREHSADGLWLLFIIALALTVLLLRVILDLTNYPQVGNSTYHVAHVLWGGLLLFIAVAVQLSFVNRYTLWLTALLGGVGAGLFIDEVGKFITQSNDYFFPLALPIIYGFMLLCLWLYWRLRRNAPRDTRTLLYHALEELQQVLDNDLDSFERGQLVDDLELVCATASKPNELRLANSLLDYVRSRELQVAGEPNFFERTTNRIRRYLAEHPARWVYKIGLVLGFVVVGLVSLLEALVIAGRVRWQDPLEQIIENVVVVSGNTIYTLDDPPFLEIGARMLMISALAGFAVALLMVVGRDRWSVNLGTLLLVFSLCVVNFLTFYYLQMLVLVEAIFQVGLLVIVGLYRWRFLSAGGEAPRNDALPWEAARSEGEGGAAP